MSVSELAVHEDGVNGLGVNTYTICQRDNFDVYVIYVV